MIDDSPRRAADLLLAARETGIALDTTGLDCAPRSLADVLTIQSRVAEALGPVGAWKIGAPSPAAESSYAPIPAAGVHRSPATLNAAGHPLRGVEAEIAYRIATDLPPRDREYTREEVAAAVDAILPVIEEVESRLADRESIDPLWPLADNLSHGALILGTPIVERWRALDVLAPHVRITFDDRVAVDRICRNAGGDPFDQVVRLANLSATHCGGVRAGQIVTTGSLMGMEPAPEGGRVVVTIEGLGGVEMRFH